MAMHDFYVLLNWKSPRKETLRRRMGGNILRQRVHPYSLHVAGIHSLEKRG